VTLPAVNRALVVLVLITTLGAVLIFANLGDRYLWDDEAETALLAQRVLRFGVPIAWDGRDLISQRCGTDYDANYLWRETPWLQFYVTALSFKLFGAGTLTARLFFGVLGVLSILSLYVLGVALFRDRALALLATAFLTLSVPFLLHVRQARYYAIAALATIWAIYFFFQLIRNRRGALLGLVLAMTVLFHSNYLAGFATAAGLGLALIAFPFDRRATLRLAGAAVATLVINLPWLAMFDMRGKADYAATGLSVQSYATKTWVYLFRIELYVCSFVLLAAFIAVRFLLIRGKPERAASWPEPRVCVALALFTLGHVLVLAAGPYFWFRYVVGLFPVFALLQAVVIRALWPVNRLAAVAACALALFVDRADLVRGRLGSPPVKYVDEITHHVPGPIAGIVSHLRAYARPGDRVFMSYGDLPIRFYTGLEVRGGLGCQGFAGWPPADWIIDRHFRFDPNGPGSAPGWAEDAERMSGYLRRVPVGDYRGVRIAEIDTVWENLPEPPLHRYRAPTDGPRLVIYRRHVR
jgi:Dolichyl-phosphate-mannose-protein mannosyltransferase